MCADMQLDLYDEKQLVFISGFRSRGGKRLVPKFKGGGGNLILDRESQLLRGANQSQGGVEAPLGLPEINPGKYKSGLAGGE